MFHRIFVAVTADVIARCAFGMKVDSLNDPNSPFVKNLSVLVLEDDDPNFMQAAVCKSIPVVLHYVVALCVPRAKTNSIYFSL